LIASFPMASDTIVVGVTGLVAMIVALTLMLLNNPAPLASIGFVYAALMVLMHGVGWVLANIIGETHYARHVNATDDIFASGVFAAGLGILFFAIGYVICNNFQRRS